MFFVHFPDLRVFDGEEDEAVGVFLEEGFGFVFLFLEVGVVFFFGNGVEGEGFHVSEVFGDEVGGGFGGEGGRGLWDECGFLV